MEYIEGKRIDVNYDIGDGTTIGQNAILGKFPKRASMSTLKEQTYGRLEIGKNVIIGDNVIIYAGTVIGDNSFIGDNTLIREKCIIGNNVLVGSGVTIEQNTEIRDYTKIQAKVYITAFTTIGYSCFLAPCVVTCNDNYMGRTDKRFKFIQGAIIADNVRIGAGAVLLPGVKIGKEAVIGAGSVVYHDVPSYKVAWGVPARVRKDTPQEEQL